jgi:hypothetical protein
MRWATMRCGVAGALALAAVATACGDPEYQYPHDGAEGVYFKVPSEWTVFDETKTSQEGRVEGGSSVTPVRVWAIDAHDPAAVTNITVRDGDHPVGMVRIFATTERLGQAVSIAAIRSDGFEFDPVSPPADLDGTWEVVIDQALRTEDGVSGAVAVFNHRETPDDPWQSQAREVYVDPSRQRIYMLDIYCNSTCFEANWDDIFDVLDSWRIEP